MSNRASDYPATDVAVKLLGIAATQLASLGEWAGDLVGSAHVRAHIRVDVDEATFRRFGGETDSPTAWCHLKEVAPDISLAFWVHGLDAINYRPDYEPAPDEWASYSYAGSRPVMHRVAA